MGYFQKEEEYVNTTASRFASQLEEALRQEVERLVIQAPPDTRPLLELVIAFEIRMQKLLNTADDISVLDPVELIGEETLWIQASTNLLSKPHDYAATLILLWTLCDLTERSSRYYREAAANSPYPAHRLFFSSVAEVKRMIRRKLDNPLRTVYNEIWGTIGFAPFDMTRG